MTKSNREKNLICHFIRTRVRIAIFATREMNKYSIYLHGYIRSMNRGRAEENVLHGDNMCVCVPLPSVWRSIGFVKQSAAPAYSLCGSETYQNNISL